MAVSDKSSCAKTTYSFGDSYSIRMRSHNGIPLYDLMDSYWLKLGGFVAWANCPWQPPPHWDGMTLGEYWEACAQAVPGLSSLRHSGTIEEVELVDGWALLIESPGNALKLEWIVVRSNREISA